MQKIFWKPKRGKIIAATETEFKTEDEFERFILGTQRISAVEIGVEANGLKAGSCRRSVCRRGGSQLEVRDAVRRCEGRNGLLVIMHFRPQAFSLQQLIEFAAQHWNMLRFL